MKEGRPDWLNWFVCISAGVLLAGMAVVSVREGPSSVREICANCGRYRQRAIWRIPGTGIGVFWKSSISNSVVGSSLLHEGILHEWRHRWLRYEETTPQSLLFSAAPSGAGAPGIQPPSSNTGRWQTIPPTKVRRTNVSTVGAIRNSPRNREFPAKYLLYQFNSPEIANWLLAVSAHSDKATFERWWQWLGNPNTSPHLLGVAVRYRLTSSELTNRQIFSAWLKGEEQKLVFGEPPKLR